MWEVSRPNLYHPLHCEVVRRLDLVATAQFLDSSWKLERRNPICGICWVQSNGQSVYITLTKLDEETLSQVGG